MVEVCAFVLPHDILVIVLLELQVFDAVAVLADGLWEDAESA